MPPIFTSLAGGSISTYGLVRRNAVTSPPVSVLLIFSSTSLWTAPADVTNIEYLVVAGGGAGGYGGSGGLGADNYSATINASAGANGGGGAGRLRGSFQLPWILPKGLN